MLVTVLVAALVAVLLVAACAGHAQDAAVATPQTIAASAAPLNLPIVVSHRRTA
ncbi:hypothetical protein GCM10009733_064300 [Nonomuraea maheshkhaliensis]|uniref:Uncharacterized protein n=1 Tax=Nonomuraea maheshkhaliensis TaxID=419590 RepID=A0ABP4RP51_9ACTN